MLRQDFKKTHRDLYGAKPEPALIDVPARSFLMIDGEGDPDVTAAYPRAVRGIVHSVLCDPVRLEAGRDHRVPGDAARKSVVDGRVHRNARAFGKWTMLIPQPPQVAHDLAAEAVATARRKKGDRDEFTRLRFETFAEGPSAQILHIGPFSAEPATHERLMTFIEEQGATLSGEHHEIYLSDPRRADPAEDEDHPALLRR